MTALQFLQAIVPGAGAFEVGIFFDMGPEQSAAAKPWATVFYDLPMEE